MSKHARSLSRRSFVAQTGTIFLGATCLKAAFAEEQKRQTLRVITYNVYECTGWPKDRALGKKATKLGQMPDRFANELALYEPDIINFSESPSEEVVKQISERLRMRYVRFPSGGKWPGTLFSRYEISDSTNAPTIGGERPKELFTRHWGKATVKLPSGDPLIVHSAHLHPSEEPDTRLREIPAMLESMKGDLAAGRSMLLIGDLNHTPDTKEYKHWTDAGWIDTFAKVGEGKGVTFMADELDRRIDYVMAAGPIARQVVESRPLFEGAFRVNAADPQAFALSDHLPQLAVFQLGQ